MKEVSFGRIPQNFLETLHFHKISTRETRTLFTRKNLVKIIIFYVGVQCINVEMMQSWLNVVQQYLSHDKTILIFQADSFMMIFFYLSLLTVNKNL